MPLAVFFLEVCVSLECQKVCHGWLIVCRCGNPVTFGFLPSQALGFTWSRLYYQGTYHPLRFSPRALLDPFEEMTTGSSWSLPDQRKVKYQGADLSPTHPCISFLTSFAIGGRLCDAILPVCVF